MPQVRTEEKTGGLSPQVRSIAVVALGSNQSFNDFDIIDTVKKAIVEIGTQLGAIRGQSRLFRTPAFPAGNGPDFVNAAVVIETDMKAPALLAALHGIEARFGRSRETRWGPRTLDLDLISYDDLVFPDRETYCNWAGLPLERQLRLEPEHLVLPHPRMHERAFVLVPMADVAPDWHHPVTGRTTRQMLDALPVSLRDEVKPI